MKSTSLPMKPHPAVNAFTMALQNDLNKKCNNNNTFNDNGSSNKKNNNSIIQKVSQTLGWRNRYSQSEYYPIEIEYNIKDKDSSSTTTATTTTKTCLQIKQVQRGEIENTFGTGATVWPASLVLVKFLEHRILQKQKEVGGGDDDFFAFGCSHGNSKSNRSRVTTIADLGSGTGVTSIATAFFLGMYDGNDDNDFCEGNDGNGNRGDEKSCKRGRSFIVCTDGIDSVVELARENIESTVNNLSSEVETKEYGEKKSIEMNMENKNKKETIPTTCNDGIYEIGQSQIKARKYLWGDGTLVNELKNINYDNDGNGDNEGDNKVAQHSHNHYDIILVSDCVLPKLYPIEPLVDAIDELAGPDSVAYLSYEYRYYPEYDPKEFFVGLASDKGLEVRTVPLEEQHPIYSVDDIEIWEIRRKNEDK
jgi:hypothetical protein